MIRKETSQQITEQQIAALEDTLSFKLPKDYCDFLLREGTGVVDGFYSVEGLDVDISQFLHVSSKSQDTMTILWFRSIDKDTLPAEVLTFAVGTGGVQFCLVLDGPLTASVILHDMTLDHDESREGPIAAEELSLVAKSFAEFLTKIVAD